MNTTREIVTKPILGFRRAVSLSSKSWPVFVLGVLATFVLFWGLGASSLIDWDEGTYAQISKQIVQSGDWLTLRIGDRLYFNKPPLFFWLTAIWYQLFGINEFTARMGSALFGVILVMMTYHFGQIIYNKWVGFISAVILLTSYQFVTSARVGMTDITLTLFIYLAFYGYTRLEAGNDKWWYLIWVAGALGFMTKSAAILVAPIVLVLLLLFDKRLGAVLKSKHFWLGFLLACTIVIPWHVMIYLQHGQSFIDIYFGMHIIERSTNALEKHIGDGHFYVGGLRYRFFPWFYLVPFALALSLRENLNGQSRSRLFLIAFTVVFGLYTLVSTKLYWYIVPLYPALALLTAATVFHAFRSYKSVAFSGLVLSTVVVALVTPLNMVLIFGSIGLLVIFLISAFKKFRTPNESDNFSLVGFKINLSKNTGGIPETFITHSIAGIMFLFLVIVGIYTVLPLYQTQESSVSRLAKIAGRSSADDQEPIVIFSGLWPQTALFYSNRPVYTAYTWGELTGFISAEETEIILARDDLEVLLAQYEVEVLAEADPLVYATIKPNNGPVSLVNQEIHYHIPEADEVFLIWGINGWNVIPEPSRPTGTIITERNVMKTPMKQRGDTFVIEIKTPNEAAVDYGFLITKKRNGSRIEAVWDGSESYQMIASEGELTIIDAQSKAVEQVITANPVESTWVESVLEHLFGTGSN